MSARFAATRRPAERRLALLQKRSDALNKIGRMKTGILVDCLKVERAGEV